jgi:hypothetical protein
LEKNEEYYIRKYVTILSNFKEKTMKDFAGTGKQHSLQEEHPAWDWDSPVYFQIRQK